jgi:hypothetical protein
MPETAVLTGWLWSLGDLEKNFGDSYLAQIRLFAMDLVRYEQIFVKCYPDRK